MKKDMLHFISFVYMLANHLVLRKPIYCSKVSPIPSTHMHACTSKEFDLQGAL